MSPGLPGWLESENIDGRAINNLEQGWPETLTGFAKRLHEAYVQHLAPQGYKIRAQILNYPDGNLGEAGIFISW